MVATQQGSSKIAILKDAATPKGRTAPGLSMSKASHCQCWRQVKRLFLDQWDDDHSHQHMEDCIEPQRDYHREGAEWKRDGKIGTAAMTEQINSSRPV